MLSFSPLATLPIGDDSSVSPNVTATLSGTGSIVGASTRKVLAVTSISGVGSVATTTRKVYATFVSFAGAGSTTVSLKKIGRTIAPLVGNGSVQPIGVVFKRVGTSLVGVGSLQASGSYRRPATSALTGSSVLAPSPVKAKFIYSNLNGVGTVTSTVQRLRGVTYVGFNEEAIRITNTGDIRVTEDGNTRFTTPLAYNQAEGTMVGASDKTQFNAVAYVKQSGIWKRMIPNVKDSSIWKTPSKMYKKINENWRRIY